jgi:hypothetical protein
MILIGLCDIFFLCCDGKKANGELFPTLPAEGPKIPKAATAEEYIAELDTAGIKRGVILSTAFVFVGCRGIAPKRI